MWRGRALVVAALLLALLLVLLWGALTGRGRELPLTVINRGDATVLLALDGSGLREPLPPLELSPGKETKLTLLLAPEGSLRLSATQPQGRVEAQLVPDVAALDGPQQLLVGPGQRYLLQAP